VSDELKPIDPNHDLVPTLRMMGGLLFDQAADEIDKWRNAYRASVKRPADELWVIGMGCVQKHKIISTPIIIHGQLHVYTDTEEGAEIAGPAQPRQPLSADDVRSQFEAWVRTRPGHPFAGKFLNLMWDAWKAARAITGDKP